MGNVSSQQASKLVANDAAGPTFQGNSVALSADGNTASVGGLYYNAGIGATWVYTRSGGSGASRAGSWSAQTLLETLSRRAVRRREHRHRRRG
jgi:hypothetical protein